MEDGGLVVNVNGGEGYRLIGRWGTLGLRARFRGQTPIRASISHEWSVCFGV
jgi:hypothetical protein